MNFHEHELSILNEVYFPNADELMSTSKWYLKFYLLEKSDAKLRKKIFYRLVRNVTFPDGKKFSNANILNIWILYYISLINR